jgi:hypothetical protein
MKKVIRIARIIKNFIMNLGVDILGVLFIIGIYCFLYSCYELNLGIYIDVLLVICGLGTILMYSAILDSISNDIFHFRNSIKTI